MWPTAFSIPKLLYFFVRYWVFVNGILAALTTGSLFPTENTSEQCIANIKAAIVTAPVLLIGAEGILFYRVWAFSGKDNRMLIYLIVQFIVIHVLLFYFVVRFMTTVKFARWQLPNNTTICMVSEGANTLLGASFVALLFSVTSAMAIMVLVAYRQHRGFDSRLLTTFYRDGIFYFVCLAGMASLNVAVNWLAYGGYKYIFVQFEMAAHCILSTRMLLHLREVGSEFDAPSCTRIIHELTFSWEGRSQRPNAHYHQTSRKSLARRSGDQ